MNIFICRTVFQVYYASVIIKCKNIPDVVFFYLTEVFSERERLVLADFVEECYVIGGTNQFTRLVNQLKVLHKLKKYKKHSDLNLYIASIDDPFIQTIISKIKFESIFSFDDGTANYVKNSIFYSEKNIKKIIKFKYLLMGNKVNSIKQIKDKINLHYSSNSLPNIISRVENVPLFKLEPSENVGDFIDGRKNIYLCPHFNEIYVNSNIVREKFISTLSTGDVVIPHPRDDFNWNSLKNLQLCNNSIAEKNINEFLNAGYHIDLYGIANSTQYHYIGIDKVNNHILALGILKEEYRPVIENQMKLFRTLSGSK